MGLVIIHTSTHNGCVAVRLFFPLYGWHVSYSGGWPCPASVPHLWAHQPFSLQPLHLGDSGPNPLILSFLSHLRTVNWAMATEAHPPAVFSFLLPISLCLAVFRMLTFEVELPSQSGGSDSSCLPTLKLILGVTGCLCSQEDTLNMVGAFSGWWSLLTSY